MPERGFWGPGPLSSLPLLSVQAPALGALGSDGTVQSLRGIIQRVKCKFLLFPGQCSSFLLTHLCTGVPRRECQLRFCLCKSCARLAPGREAPLPGPAPPDARQHSDALFVMVPFIPHNLAGRFLVNKPGDTGRWETRFRQNKQNEYRC